MAPLTSHRGFLAFLNSQAFKRHFDTEILDITDLSFAASSISFGFALLFRFSFNGVTLSSLTLTAIVFDVTPAFSERGFLSFCLLKYIQRKIMFTAL